MAGPQMDKRLHSYRIHCNNHQYVGSCFLLLKLFKSPTFIATFALLGHTSTHLKHSNEHCIHL